MWEETDAERREFTNCSPETAIAELAARQHAVFSLLQLMALGMSERSVQRRAAAGKLHRVHRGVYALVPLRLLTRRGRWMAATLAYHRAVLSHCSAARLLGFRRGGGRIEVSTIRAARPKDGLIVHRVRRLPPREVIRVENIPCTTVHRTLLDMAATRPEAEVTGAIRAAEDLRLFDLRELQAMEGRPGSGVLLRLAQSEDPAAGITRSELEEVFLAMCTAASLPLPAANVWLAHLNLEADFLWEGARLIVECDSWEFHGTRGAFESDRERDQRLLAAGYATFRCTWRQVLDDPAGVAERLRAALRTHAA